VYKIRTNGAAVLHKPAEMVTVFDKKLKSLVKNLWDTQRACREPKAIGLAAPQIGKSVRVAVVAAHGFVEALINPRITGRVGKQETLKEGCLSLPGKVARVLRFIGIKVEWQDVEGRPREAYLEGLAAQAVQHELDHLDGKLV